MDVRCIPSATTHPTRARTASACHHPHSANSLFGCVLQTPTARVTRAAAHTARRCPVKCRTNSRSFRWLRRNSRVVTIRWLYSCHSPIDSLPTATFPTRPGTRTYCTVAVPYAFARRVLGSFASWLDLALAIGCSTFVGIHGFVDWMVVRTVHRFSVQLITIRTYATQYIHVPVYDVPTSTLRYATPLRAGAYLFLPCCSTTTTRRLLRFALEPSTYRGMAADTTLAAANTVPPRASVFDCDPTCCRLPHMLPAPCSSPCRCRTVTQRITATMQQCRYFGLLTTTPLVARGTVSYAVMFCRGRTCLQPATRHLYTLILFCHLLTRLPLPTSHCV